MKSFMALTALILSLTLAFSCSVVCAESDSFMMIADSNGSEVLGSVSASSEIYVKGVTSPGEIVILSVIMAADESGVLNDNAFASSLYWADDTVSGVDGSYNFYVDFSGCSTGDYLIRVSTSSDDDIISKTLSVINVEDRDSAIGAINDADDIYDIENLFVNSDGARNLSLNTKAFQRLDSKLSVYESIMEYKSKNTLTAANLEEFNYGVFLPASALALYNQENSSDVIKEFENEFKLLNNENVKNAFDLIGSADEQQTALETICKTDYVSIADMQKAYGVSVVLYAVKNAPWQSFDGIVKANEDLFESLAVDKYNKLKSKSKVALEMSGKLYSSAKDFEEEFNSAVEKQYKSEQTSSGNGGGGSGGGSYGGSSASSFSNVSVSGAGAAIEELEPVVYDGFYDIADYKWAKNAIEYLYEKGIVSGVSANIFAPENSVKREEFVKILVLIMNKYNPVAKCSFSDVPADNWCYSYIGSAYDAGLIQGVDEHKFGMGTEITRQDACVLLYRALSEMHTDGVAKEFSDKEDIDEYALIAVNAMSSAGIVNGMEDGSFKPKDFMTRAEAAKLLYEFCQVIGG